MNSNVLDAMRLGLETSEADHGVVYAQLYGKALYQLEAMATGTAHRTVQECLRELRTIERAHGIHLSDLLWREEHEGIEPIERWGRGESQ